MEGGLSRAEFTAPGALSPDWRAGHRLADRDEERSKGSGSALQAGVSRGRRRPPARGAKPTHMCELQVTPPSDLVVAKALKCGEA